MYDLTGVKDYKPGPYSATFAAGEKRFLFGNPVIDDQIVENVEYFVLIINSSSLPSGVIVGEIAHTRVTIYDDDCECIAITIYHKHT